MSIVNLNGGFAKYLFLRGNSSLSIPRTHSELLPDRNSVLKGSLPELPPEVERPFLYLNGERVDPSHLPAKTIGKIVAVQIDGAMRLSFGTYKENPPEDFKSLQDKASDREVSISFLKLTSEPFFNSLQHKDLLPKGTTQVEGGAAFYHSKGGVLFVDYPSSAFGIINREILKKCADELGFTLNLGLSFNMENPKTTLV